MKQNDRLEKPSNYVYDLSFNGAKIRPFKQSQPESNHFYSAYLIIPTLTPQGKFSDEIFRYFFRTIGTNVKQDKNAGVIPDAFTDPSLWGPALRFHPYQNYKRYAWRTIDKAFYLQLL